MTENILISYWNKFKSEIKYEKLIAHPSYGAMYQKFESEMLYSVIRAIKPIKIMEWGCYHGFTSYIIILAMKANRQKSELFSFDLLADSKNLDYKNKLTSRKLIEGNITQTINNYPINCDFLFIDSKHTKNFARWYCGKVIPFIESNATVFIHDWEGIEGEGAPEILGVIEYGINKGYLQRIMNLMEYTLAHPELSSTPKQIRGRGDRNPTQILIKTK